MRREVNSRVSALTISAAVSASSSRCRGGSSESGSSAKSGTWRSFSTRSDLGISTTGGSMRMGSCSSKRRRSSDTAASRRTVASRPALRSCQVCQALKVPK